MQIVAELDNNTTFEQTIIRPLKKISTIQIKAATFQREDIDGYVYVEIYNNTEKIAGKEFEGSQIQDGDYLCVNLDNKNGIVGDELKIVISSSSSQERCIGIWASSTGYSKLLEPTITINGNEPFTGITNMMISYENCNMAYIWWLFVGSFIVCTIVFFVPEDIAKRVDKSKLFEYAFVFVLAVGILCLRGGVFSFSGLYAEDGIYMSNIINKGFWKSCFATRHGGSDDFYNVGLYLLIEVCLFINKLVIGYDLEYLPMIMGIVGSVFWSIIALFAYHIYRKKNIVLAISFYGCVVCVPVGVSTMEIFGRIGNLVWMFLTLAILILNHMWDRRYIFSVQNIIYEFLLLICGLTFPVSFGAVGIWLIIGGCLSIKQKNVVKFLKANVFKILIIIIGMILLPTMIGSKGGSAGYEVNSNAFVEYFIERHLLYIFTYLWYKYLNDYIVIILFAITLLIIIAAIIKEYKSKKEIGVYFVTICMGFGCIFVAAIMRLPMSALCGGYTSTFPERYYFVYNILYCFIVFEGIYIITKEKLNEINKVIFISFVIIISVNTDLFPKMKKDTLVVTGSYLKDIKSFNDCVSYSISNDTVENNKYLIRIFPIGENNSWIIELPCEYVWASAD
jgi:hypothetical protein